MIIAILKRWLKQLTKKMIASIIIHLYDDYVAIKIVHRNFNNTEKGF